MENMVIRMRELFDGFYKGKKVLVTGHTGFKGAWLTAWLLKRGAEVTGYALEPPTVPSLFESAGLSGMITSVKGDIRDFKGVKAVFEEQSPDIVIHMAAQSLVRRSYKEPLCTYETNVIGTVNVLEICRHTPTVRSVINVTSDKCYENRDIPQGYDENDPLGGYDPYSSSKGCSELVTRAYLRSFFNPKDYNGKHRVALASVRSGNVIGGGDWSEDRLIPDSIKAFSAGETLDIRYPDAVRPWQYVLESIYGYLLLAKRLYEDGPVFSGAWNFGPSSEDAKPVKWIVEHMVSMWGSGAKWCTDNTEKPHEESTLRLDCSKARIKLNWEPHMDLYPALDRTVKWYKAYYAEKDMSKETFAELENFENSISSSERFAGKEL